MSNAPNVYADIHFLGRLRNVSARHYQIPLKTESALRIITSPERGCDLQNLLAQLATFQHPYSCDKNIAMDGTAIQRATIQDGFYNSPFRALKGNRATRLTHFAVLARFNVRAKQ